MRWIRRGLYTFGYWLGAKANVYEDRPHDPSDRWWDVSVSFEGTQKEAEELLDHMVGLACGNPKCGEFGEHCKRDWAGGSKLTVHQLRLEESPDWDSDENANTNHTAVSWNYTNTATGEVTA